jgi:glyoxylase-like metal-dependent hydrolase (beta-lactamase superfamily II)
MFSPALPDCLIDYLRLFGVKGSNRYILPHPPPREESKFVKQPEIKLATIVSQPFGENTYIARLDGRDDCVVVDPGLEPEKIVRYLRKHELTPAALLNTHGHGDHIGGNGALKELWPRCPVVIGRDDASKLTDPIANLSASFGMSLVCPPADITVDEGDTYEAAGIEFQVRAIPGHSVGHVVYLWEGREPPLVFVGDVIFAGSIGRTDFPGGDHRGLVLGIRAKLFTLPDDTMLLPGHGPATTVGEEKRSNPFAGLGARI